MNQHYTSLIRKSIWRYERNHIRFFYLRILNPKHTFVISLIASLKPRHANKSDWTDGVSLKIYSVGHVCARVNDAIELLATRSSERIKRFSRIASQNYLTVFHEYIRNSTIQQEAGPAKIQDLDRSIFFFSLPFFSLSSMFSLDRSICRAILTRWT